MVRLESLPPTAAFWRASTRRADALKRHQQEIDSIRAEQRKRLQLGSPPIFPHRHR